MDKDKNCKLEGENSMSTVLANKEDPLKAKLNKISAKADVLTGKKGMIELNEKNPLHKEWFEEDKYKGK